MLPASFPSAHPPPGPSRESSSLTHTHTHTHMLCPPYHDNSGSPSLPLLCNSLPRVLSLSWTHHLRTPCVLGGNAMLPLGCAPNISQAPEAQDNTLVYWFLTVSSFLDCPELSLGSQPPACPAAPAPTPCPSPCLPLFLCPDLQCPGGHSSACPGSALWPLDVVSVVPRTQV